MSFALFYEIPGSRPWDECSFEGQYWSMPRRRVPRLAKGSEEIGTDLLFCAVQPCNISHDRVMASIELLGSRVLPAFDH